MFLQCLLSKICFTNECGSCVCHSQLPIFTLECVSSALIKTAWLAEPRIWSKLLGLKVVQNQTLRPDPL